MTSCLVVSVLVLVPKIEPCSDFCTLHFQGCPPADNRIKSIDYSGTAAKRIADLLDFCHRHFSSYDTHISQAKLRKELPLSTMADILAPVAERNPCFTDSVFGFQTEKPRTGLTSSSKHVERLPATIRPIWFLIPNGSRSPTTWPRLLLRRRIGIAQRIIKNHAIRFRS